ncbi:MAG: T9SS type A sorting domain-containing protein [Flavobacteriales bacterium]|nr:T9SS type A sorting domain-containing protein [Flavobacteriales bacterium]
MKYIRSILFILIVARGVAFSQYPAYINEKEVTINGLTFDAMEPFISPDKNYLIFNNLNDGVTTKLYYATRVNDSTFNFVGEVVGTNQTTTPYLDAVPDMDSSSVFYWTSSRDYPNQLDNLHRGVFSGGTVSGIQRVHGDFNMGIPGWLVMDHGISYNGQLLYYNNARFDGICTGPCETHIGIAQKVNDSTFTKIANSDSILGTINDTNYIYYATYISTDNLELYYTRYLKGTITPSTSFEICVAVRNSPTDTFSVPAVLFSEFIADIVEAPCLTVDKQLMYYHKKVAGIHKIMMRERAAPLSVDEQKGHVALTLYPNPGNGKFRIDLNTNKSPVTITILNATGKLISTRKFPAANSIDFELEGSAGIYFVQVQTSEAWKTLKLIKE